MTWEHPVDSEGHKVDPDTLRERIEGGDEKWAENKRFPFAACDVPCLRFTDISAAENVRRYAEASGSSVMFLGATENADDREILEAVFPDLQVRTHPYPARKIKQLAVASLDGHHGINILAGPEALLVTEPLESYGFVLIFCATKDDAHGLYNEVKRKHLLCYAVDENDGLMIERSSLRSDEQKKCCIAYSRSVLGKGVNLEGLRILVIDTSAFRPISSFAPGELSHAEFDYARARERLGLMMQNIGRLLRGDSGKIACVILLNADDDLIGALLADPAIREACDLPPVFARSDDLSPLVEGCRRCVAAGGGSWPDSDPGSKKPRKRRKKHPDAGEKARSIFDHGRQAVAAGWTKRQFSRSNHPERHLPQEELEKLAALFKSS
jgi:hypothetical protein